MTTYVAFDGDKDIWAYGYIRGWSANHRIDFELLDAHDLDNMTARARGEYYVKGKLRDGGTSRRRSCFWLVNPRSICTSTLAGRSIWRLRSGCPL
jgi:hypothetical protein